MTPWYRSRLFFFGLAGLVMLLWLWFGFPSISPSVAFHTSKSTYGASYEDGSFYYGYYQYAHPENADAVPPSGFEFAMQDNRNDAYWLNQVDLFDPALVVSIGPWNGGVDLAIWVIVVLYTALWLSGLVCWQRRKRRLMHTQPQ